MSFCSIVHTCILNAYIAASANCLLLVSLSVIFHIEIDTSCISLHVPDSFDTAVCRNFTQLRDVFLRTASIESLQLFSSVVVKS